jgi:hypothetical protein
MMRSSSWPILMGLIVLVAGAVWFDAVHESQAAAAAAAHVEANAMK